MRRRNETRFECRWGEINSLCEHRMEKPVECRRVALHDFLIAAWWLQAKVEPKHAAHCLRRKTDVICVRRGGEAIRQLPRRSGEARIKLGRFKGLQGSQPCSDGDWI